MDTPMQEPTTSPPSQPPSGFAPSNKHAIALVSPYVRALLNLDTRSIQCPRYKGFDFDYIKTKVTYKNFRNDVLNVNKDKIISRKEMEAVWVRKCFRRWRDWQVLLSDIELDGKALPTWMRAQVDAAIAQRSGSDSDDVDLWWEERAKKIPGLDIAAPPADVVITYTDIIRARHWGKPYESSDEEEKEEDTGDKMQTNFKQLNVGGDDRVVIDFDFDMDG